MLIVYIIGLVINFTGLVIWLYLNSQKEIRYVDRSGIVKNPPTFIETWENKTINFDFNGKIIRISHLSFRETYEYIGRISTLFTTLSIRHDETMKDFGKDFKLTWNELVKIVDAISVLIYQLSKPQLTFWERIGRRKWMIKKGREDSDFIIGLASEIYDYWQNLGNQLALMAKGATVRMIHGQDASLNTIKKDFHGKKLVGPRHDSSIYTSIMNPKSSNTKSQNQETLHHFPGKN